jgi:DNA-binding response OmpR family regulator
MAKIILLEPNTLLGKAYTGALEQKNHNVVWCPNAQQAIHQTDKHSPDLIITELQLATHNGIEFLYELRSYSDWQKIPVVVLSHVAQTNAGLKLWENLNIAAYLYKPLAKLRDITATIDHILVGA